MPVQTRQDKAPHDWFLGVVTERGAVAVGNATGSGAKDGGDRRGSPWTGSWKKYTNWLQSQDFLTFGVKCRAQGCPNSGVHGAHVRRLKDDVKCGFGFIVPLCDRHNGNQYDFPRCFNLEPGTKLMKITPHPSWYNARRKDPWNPPRVISTRAAAKALKAAESEQHAASNSSAGAVASKAGGRRSAAGAREVRDTASSGHKAPDRKVSLLEQLQGLTVAKLKDWLVSHDLDTRVKLRRRSRYLQLACAHAAEHKQQPSRCRRCQETFG